MMRFHTLQRALALALLSVLAGCAGFQDTPDGMRPPYQFLVMSPERSEADRELDKRRKPIELLGFYDVRAGMRVLDMGAGAGYNTELLAWSVGPHGSIYAQNSQMFIEKFVKGRFEERRKQQSAMRRAILFVRDFDDPIPSDIRNLDLVTFNFNYHDMVLLKVDRAKMNRAVFEALKPGGAYVVADHSARPGTGSSAAKLHRIDEALVREEIEAAGFTFAAEGDFLRNPEDGRDTLIFKSEVPTDRFIFKFVKPK